MNDPGFRSTQSPWRAGAECRCAAQTVRAEAGPMTANDVVAEWMRPRQLVFRRFVPGCK